VLIALVAVGSACLALVLALVATTVRSRRRLRRDRARHTHTASRLSRALSDAAAAEREASWAVGAGQRRIRRLEEELAATRMGAVEAERRIDSLQESVRAAEAHLTALSRTADSDSDRVVELEGTVSRLDAELAATRTEAESARARSESLERDLQAARTDHDAARAALRRVESERDEAHRSREELAGRLARLERETEAAPVVDPKAPDEVVELRRALARRTTELSRIREALHQAHSETERAGRRADQLSAELDRVRTETGRTLAAAASALPQPGSDDDPGVVERLRARLLARDAELADLDERLTALAAVRTAEVKRMTARITQLERLYVEVDRRDQQIRALEAELKDSTELVDGLRDESHAMEVELEQLRAGARREDTLHSQLASALASLEDARTRVAQLESGGAGGSGAELRSLRTALAAERDRNARLTRRHNATATTRAIERAVAAAVAPLEAELARTRERGPGPEPRDDVTAIKGIGPAIAAILATEGISSIHDIARFTRSDIERIGPLLPVYPGRIEDDHWVEQAREIALRLGDR
jgi:predicted flap endonuclease-1-like 5' DNA nuclease